MGVERQGRRAGPTRQDTRVGLIKGTETARSARKIIRGKARLKGQEKLKITASLDGWLTVTLVRTDEMSRGDMKGTDLGPVYLVKKKKKEL